MQAGPQTSGSVSVARVFGVPIRFHFTFLLLLAFLVVWAAQGQSSLAGALYVAGLFLSVLLHELGHALVSRRYGIRTLEIVLFPIGGVARLERNPAPREELFIALAGPLVNVVVGAALLAAGVLREGGPEATWPLRIGADNLLVSLAGANLLLAAFNLLPAFPMDGGRMLRAYLALSRPENEATQIAARAGRWLAAGIGLYGLLSANFLLVFVAFFVYVGAVQESAAAVGRALTTGVPVRAAMITDFRTLAHGQTIRDAANLLLATSQQDFPVVHGGEVLGLLSRNALLRAMAQEGPDAYISAAIDRNYLSVAPGMDLSEAAALLTRAGSCALVMENGALCGLLTTENLTEYLLVRQFERLSRAT